jgi:hypothetical protein
MEELARRFTATGKRATVTVQRTVMDVRREELARMGVDGAGLAVTCGLLMLAGFGWFIALALILWKWFRYGLAKLQAVAAELPE